MCEGVINRFISSCLLCTGFRYNGYGTGVREDATSRPCSLPLKRRTCFTTKAILSSTREDVLKHFNERRALKGGATLLDIACDPELVNLAIDLTSCPVNSYLLIDVLATLIIWLWT
ncbi:hypothetical protein JHK87_027052 [Glycine soja]|nr:hypothetical protein JHK87_027052 [Glycine soja]